MVVSGETSWARFSGGVYGRNVELADLLWFHVIEDVSVPGRDEGQCGLPFGRPDMPRRIRTAFSCPGGIALCILPRVVGLHAGQYPLAAVQSMALAQ